MERVGYTVQNVTPTLWAGTNNGTVYVFTIAVPGGNKRTEEPVSCQLGEYQPLHNYLYFILIY